VHGGLALEGGGELICARAELARSRAMPKPSIPIRFVVMGVSVFVE
jgi:hypothetical protein